MRTRRGTDNFVPYLAGEGTDRSIVEFVPSQELKFEQGNDSFTEDPSLGFTTLGHELIHSVHQLHGTAYRADMG